MDISQLSSATVLSDYKQIGQRSETVLARLGSGLQAASPADDPLLWGDVAELKASTARIQSHTENLYRASSSVRIALASMETSDVQLDEMGKALDSAREAPVGSDARRQALEHYNTIYDLTDALSQPADMGARKLLDSPDRFAAAGNLEVAAGPRGFDITLRHEPIHLGADGLDLPLAGGAQPSDATSVPIVADITNASNDEIDAMMAHLGRSRELLSLRMSSLSSDVAMVEQSTSFNESQVSGREVLTAEIETADLEAEAVLAQALNLRSDLALRGLSGFTETRSLILQLIQ